MPAILELDNLCKAFGAITVADQLNLDLPAGQAMGIIGPNGAGKTTLFNLITGTLAADSGRVRFAGRDITRNGAAARCRAGMARSFQVPQPFSGLTVFENAMVAATQAANLPAGKAQQHCLHTLSQTGLLDKANVQAGKLTLLERKRLELSRALCARPKLLLLDEIAGGLTEAECESLITTIQDIHRDGMTIIWIEHVVHALLAVVDRLIVINFGAKIADGEPRAIMQSAQVQDIYLGLAADA